MLSKEFKNFMVVAEVLSFSKAGEQLFISPVAIMKQINSLEEELKLQLFIRTNKGLELTKAGQALYNSGKYISNFCKTALLSATSAQYGDTTDLVRIGISLMTPANYIFDVWSKSPVLKDKFKIEIIPYNNALDYGKDILAELGKNIDVIFGIFDEKIIERDKLCNYLKLKELEMKFAVPIKNPLSNKTLLTLNDIKDETILMVKKGMNSYVDLLRKYLTNHDVEISDVDFFNFKSYETANRTGYPIVSFENWRDIHTNLNLISFEKSFKVPYGAMYALNPNPNVKEFIKTVSEMKDTISKILKFN